MSWHNGPMIGWDLETTGVDVENDRIVQAALVVVNPAIRLVDPDVQIINPGIDIPEGASRIHGIDNAKAERDGGKPAEVLEHYAAELTAGLLTGAPIVGMNLVFDLTLFDRELRRNGLGTLEQRLNLPIAPVVDISVIDKACHPYREGGRKLVDLCQHYGVKLSDEDAHDAGADALASVRVAWKIVHWGSLPDSHFADPARRIDVRDTAKVAGNYRRFAALNLQQVHEAQVKAKQQQDASLAEHFRKQNKPFDGLDGHWPLRPYAGQQAMPS